MLRSYADPVQHRQEQHREGERETGRDLLLQARVAEEKNEKEQSEPQNVQREEERRDEERGDRDAGRAAVEESLRRLPEVVDEARPVPDEEHENGGESGGAGREQEDQDEAHEHDAPRLAVGERRAKRPEKVRDEIAPGPRRGRERQARPAGLGEVRIEAHRGGERLARDLALACRELAAPEKRRGQGEVRHAPDLDLLGVLEDLVHLGARQRAVSLFLRGEPAEPLSADQLPECRLVGFTGRDEDLGTGGNRGERARAGREETRRHARAGPMRRPADGEVPENLSRASPREAGRGASPSGRPRAA